MKLTIEHLAAYLPYEVKINLNRPRFERTNINLMGLTIAFNSSTNEHFIIKSDITYGLEHIQPLLRPLSDLTKEIEHNGERFVPIERLFANYGETFIANYNDGSQITLTATYKLMGETYTDFIVCRDSFEFVRYEYVKKLLSWHFDCFGLIESGLAIQIKPIDNEQQD